MRILALDCSSKTVSAAICDGETLVGQFFLNAGLTHSETLMPMISQLLDRARIEPESLDALALTRGPGSFTGLRIGISAALGLCWSLSLPCCGVSSLEAAAWNAAHTGQRICAVMDARREQVYRAFFEPEDGGLRRITEDQAVSMECLRGEIGKKKIILVGDGAKMCYTSFRDEADGLTLAPEPLIHPSGYGVALAALAAHRAASDTGGAFADAALLKPFYLRVPQAERERSERAQKDAAMRIGGR